MNFIAWPPVCSGGSPLVAQFSLTSIHSEEIIIIDVIGF